MPGTNLVLYDGVCGLCDRSVKFLLPRDKHRRLTFAPLQSALAQDILKRHGLPLTFESFVLVTGHHSDDEKVYRRSQAALRVLALLGGRYRLVAGLGQLFPTFFADWVYRLVARHRYRWFGKYDACVLPSPETRERFLALDDVA